GGAVDDRQGRTLVGRARQALRDLVEVALAVVTIADEGELRLRGAADVLLERAAVDEDATWLLLPELREEARDRVEPPVVLAAPRAWDEAQQTHRVRMPRLAQDLGDIAVLDELAGVEHADAVAHLADDAEVVADQERGGVVLLLEVRDEVQHLGLDRRVEARRRLVQDQQLGIGGERHGDHDALLHAAGELVRIPAQDGLGVGDLDLSERTDRAFARLVAARSAQREDLTELASHSQRRVERGAGVLVDHRDLVAAQLTQ